MLEPSYHCTSGLLHCMYCCQIVPYVGAKDSLLLFQVWIRLPPLVSRIGFSSRVEQCEP